MQRAPNTETGLVAASISIASRSVELFRQLYERSSPRPLAKNADIRAIAAIPALAPNPYLSATK